MAVNHWTGDPKSEPPKAGRRIVQHTRYNLRPRGSENTHLIMVTEGTLAFAKESQDVFREAKCCSNKRTYCCDGPPPGFPFQLFLRSIFRLITISLRLSKEDTLFTGDFAPSSSA